MPETSQPPLELFQKESHRNAFNGLLFTRRNGDLLLVPVHEIASVATSATPENGGRVEIHTRRHLIRLVLSEIEACRRFVALFIRGEVNHVREGTAPVQIHQSSIDREAAPPKNVTLVIHITDCTGADESNVDQDESIAAPAPRLGFPSI